MEDDAVARVVGLDRVGDQAVEREGLVGRAHHQRLVDVADEALGGRQGLDVIGIEAVEGAEHRRGSAGRPWARRDWRRAGGGNRPPAPARHAWRWRRGRAGSSARAAPASAARATKSRQAEAHRPHLSRAAAGPSRRGAPAHQAPPAAAGTAKFRLDCRVRIWKEVAGDAIAAARPFMAALSRQGMRRSRRARPSWRLITDRKDDS